MSPERIIEVLDKITSAEELRSVFKLDATTYSKEKLLVSLTKPLTIIVSGNTYEWRESIKEAAAAAGFAAQWTGSAWAIATNTAPACVRVLKELAKLKTNVVFAINEESLQSLRPTAPREAAPGVVLFPFQSEGVERIVEAYRSRQRSFLLADEMGLGKTYQALVAAREIGGEAVIVAPASLVPQWAQAAARVGVAAQVFSYAKASDANAKDKILILDEAHFVKNPKAQRTKAVRELVKQARFMIALTGTPLLNRIEEFAHLLESVALIDSAYRFLSRYASYEYRRVSRTKDVKEYYLTKEQQERLRAMLNSSSTYLRRVKSEVSLQLPAKLRSIIPLPTQAAAATRALVSAAKEVADKLGVVWRDERELIEAVFEHLPGSAISTARRLYAIAKANAAAKYLEELLESTDKPVVVFYHHREVLDVLKSTIAAPHIDGSVPATDRARLVEEFQAGGHRVIYLSITAAGVGLTLTAADTAVFAEYDWVPANLLQAEDRINRIGQESNTTYYHYLTSSDSVEQLILKKLLSKTALAAGVLGGDKLTLS